MAAGSLGSKHACPKCKAKFYDLGQSKLVCPKCGVDVPRVEKAPVKQVTNLPSRKPILPPINLLERVDLKFVSGDAENIPVIVDDEDEEIEHLKEHTEHHEVTEEDDVDEKKMVEETDDDSVVLINSLDDADADGEDARSGTK